MGVKFATIDINANEIEFLRNTPQLLLFPRFHDLNPAFYKSDHSNALLMSEFMQKGYDTISQIETRDYQDL